MEGGSSARVGTKDGPAVSCSAVVVATNTPVNDRLAIHTKQAPYMTYALGVSVPRGWVSKGLYWDTLDPYHYVRLQRLETTAGAVDPSKEELLIVGGEDHKTGQAADPDERYRRLETWRGALSAHGSGGVSLVGTGDGDHRRSRLHRPQSRR